MVVKVKPLKTRAASSKLILCFEQRLKILTKAEREELYSIPQFDLLKRQKNFTLSEEIIMEKLLSKISQGNTDCISFEEEGILA